MKEKYYSLIPFAKKLRKDQTDTERRLWKFLRSKQLSKFKFRRQTPIGPYIVDFVCFERKIIIECDGGQHAENKRQDQERDKWLEDQGFKVLRFWDNIVLQETESVLEIILNKCKENHPPLNPLPSREGKCH